MMLRYAFERYRHGTLGSNRVLRERSGDDEGETPSYPRLCIRTQFLQAGYGAVTVQVQQIRETFSPGHRSHRFSMRMSSRTASRNVP